MTPRLTYFKRFRMELPLIRDLPTATLPPGYDWLPWDDSLLSTHAATKHHCFREHLDSRVFPSLGDAAGCVELMDAIRWRDDFCPHATWLIATPESVVATVQGLCDRKRLGAIQNLGVVPGYRGMGLGEAILLKALHGFRRAGANRVYLEVTATNVAAIQLYRKHGFRCTRTIYKGVEVPEPATVGVGI